MSIKAKLKARDLRKKTDKELLSMLSETDREIMRFRTAQHHQGLGNPPTGPHGGVMWGLYQTLKKNKAIILTVLTEKGFKRPGIR